MREAFPSTRYCLPLHLMSDWKALKERRAHKGPLLASTTATKREEVTASASESIAEGGVPAAGKASQTISSTSTLTHATTESAPAPAPPVASSSKLAQHDDLPSSLEVRKVAGRGRGVFSKASISTGALLISRMKLSSRITLTPLSLRSTQALRRCRQPHSYPYSTTSISPVAAAPASSPKTTSRQASCSRSARSATLSATARRYAALLMLKELR